MKLSRQEAEWLLTRLGEDPFRLRTALMQIVNQHIDAAEKLAEITARAMACAHYTSEYAPPHERKPQRHKSPRKRKCMEIAVDHIAEDRRAALLAAALKLRGGD